MKTKIKYIIGGLVVIVIVAAAIFANTQGQKGAFMRFGARKAAPTARPARILIPKVVPFQFELSSQDATIVTGGTAVVPINVKYIAGAKTPVTLSSTGLGGSETISFTNNACVPDCVSNLVITMPYVYAPGSYSLSVYGVSEQFKKRIDIKITVGVPHEIPVPPEGISEEPLIGRATSLSCEQIFNLQLCEERSDCMWTGVDYGQCVQKALPQPSIMPPAMMLPLLQPPPVIFTNKAEFVQAVVTKLNIDVSNYKGCAPDAVGTWYENAVCYFIDKNLLSLKLDGKVHAEDNLNRAEGALLFARAVIAQNKWYQGNAQFYTDVPLGTWFYEAVNTLAVNGVSDVPAGQNFTFDAGNVLTRESLKYWIDRI